MWWVDTAAGPDALPQTPPSHATGEQSPTGYRIPLSLPSQRAHQGAEALPGSRRCHCLEVLRRCRTRVGRLSKRSSIRFSRRFSIAVSVQAELVLGQS